jgi:twitching motility protein PilT
MTWKDVQREFTAANWGNKADFDRFLRDAQAQDGADLLKLLPLVQDGSDPSSPVRRARLTAFARMTEQVRDPRLFATLLKASRQGDEALRKTLIPLLVQCSEPRHHGEVVAGLKSAELADRRFAATVLRQIGGRTALEAIEASLPGGGWTSRTEAMELAAELGGHYAIEVLTKLLGIGSPQEKLMAVRLLADPRYVKARRRAALEALRVALADTQFQVVIEAIKGMGQLASEDEYWELIGPFLESADRRVQLAVLRTLSSFPKPRTVHEIARLYRTGQPTIREVAVRVLGEIGLEECLPILVQALSDPHLPVRNAALDTVVDLGKQRRVEMGRMVLWLLRSPDVNVRRSALEVVRQVGDPMGELWPRLLRLLRDEDWWIRERVVDVLVEVAGSELTRHVVAYLNDDSDVIRRYAVEVLMRIRDPRSVGALVRAAQEDKDWWVRERAVEAIGVLGEVRAVPHVIAMAEADPALGYAAVQALGQLRSPDALRFLGRALAAEDADLRLEALSAVEAVGDPSVSGWVQPLLDDRDHRVRTCAENLLHRWRTQVEAEASGVGVGERLTGLERLLWTMVKAGGDDLFLVSDRPPLMKRHGEMVPLSERVVTPEQVELTLRSVMMPVQIDRMDQLLDVDFSYEIPSLSRRFRANVFRQNDGWSAVFRKISSDVFTFEHLGLPKVIERLCDLPDGLVLIGGPTGSGKSTTLASMIHHLNGHYGKHIITIEDPIEVVHEHRRSLMTQREVGTHTRSFSAALRSTLREDPDVILVGEMRDLETISFAISAAETGHLVFGTVHTASAVNSVDRLINTFPGGQQGQVRAMLAQTLRAVVCQQLLRRRDAGGRALAVEVLLNNDAVANIIRKGQAFQLHSIIATSREQGMQGMDAELMRLLRAGVITPEEAYVKALDKRDFEPLIAGDGGPGAVAAPGSPAASRASQSGRR